MLVERNPKLLEAVKYNAAPASQKDSLLATRKVFLLASGRRSAYPTMQQLCMRVAGLTGRLVLLQRFRFPLTMSAARCRSCCSDKKLDLNISKINNLPSISLHNFKGKLKIALYIFCSTRVAS